MLSNIRSPRRRRRAIFITAALLLPLAVSAALFFRLYTLLDRRPAADDDAISAYTEESAAPAGTQEDRGEENLRVQILAELSADGGSPMSDADVVNILLIGSDTRVPGERARSDAMLLVSVDRRGRRLVLTSFQRDIYTYIPDHGFDRLNVPYAIAGGDCLIKTLEADFGVAIDGYAAVEFGAFASLVDAVGGIDLALTDGERAFINATVGADAPPLEPSDGPSHLNGAQVLAHCRDRSSFGSDFDRTARQRAVLSALVEKARGLSLPSLYALVKTALPLVTTDLGRGDILALLVGAPEYLGYEIVSLRIPAEDFTFVTVNGRDVINIDFAANARILAETIYG